MEPDGVVDARDDSDALDALLRDGYVVVRGGVADALCDAANADIDEFKARNRRDVLPNLDADGRLRRVVNLHGAIDSCASLFSTNRALALCDRFFDDETVLWTSLFFERGSEQALHRDSPLFCTRPEGKYLGVWVALEDIDAENGPLVVVPGSHALPAVDVHAMAVELYGDPANAPALDDVAWNAYQGAVQAEAQAHGLRPVEMHVRRGDVIIWHPLLLHGGASHRSARRTRRSMVFHVTPYGTAVHGQDFFFDPSKPEPAPGPERYDERDGRRLTASDKVDFAHEYTISIALLQRPGAGAGERLGTAMRRATARLRGTRRSGSH